MDKLKIPFLQHGGKTRIAKWVVGHFPKHDVYLEPFVGGGSVIISKTPSRIEMINDLDKSIFNIFKQIKANPKELAAALWATPYAKSNFDYPSLNEIDMAVIAMAKGKQFYCGNRNTSTWRPDAKTGSLHKTWIGWYERIIPLAARLRNVQILCEDALLSIRRVYNNKDALIYIDPPYYNHEDEYEFKIDYDGMVSLLNSAQAKVIVSEFEESSTKWSGWNKCYKICSKKNHRGIIGDNKREVLFTNFECILGCNK